MASKALQELGCAVIQDLLGELCAEVFSTLSTNGRSSRPRIQQLSRIPGRQLKTALACMTQLHILLHQTTDDDQTFYQIDWRHTYSLVRSSSVIHLVDERFGETAAKTTAFILRLGHARIRDLVEAFDVNKTPAKPLESHVGGKVNGTERSKEQNNGISSISQLHFILRKLLRTGILAKVGKNDYTPAADQQAEIEEIVIADQFPDRKITGPKKQAEFNMAVNSLKRKRREADDFSEVRDVQSGGIDARSAKRTKLSNATRRNAEEGSLDSGPQLPDDMVVRINYAQCTCALRSQQLEDLAALFLPSATASVYGALLQVLESKCRARDDDVRPTVDSDDERDEGPVASTREIADLLDPTINLNTFIGTDETNRLTNGHTKNHKSKRVQSREEAADYALLGIKQEPDSEDDYGANGVATGQGRGARLELIEEHLRLLEEHQLAFCRHSGPPSRGEWQVQYATLIDALIRKNIDDTIMARLGPLHIRLVRMLRDKGRIDEKQIATACMMRPRDVRSILTQLQYVGFVETQDVPKESQRHASKTIFLYFYDQNRVKQQLLQRTYTAMTRVFQRLQLERQRYASAIDKAENMDTSQAALNQHEREAVMQWRALEEKLLLQIERLDGQVALLRDFSGKDISLTS